MKPASILLALLMTCPSWAFAGEHTQRALEELAQAAKDKKNKALILATLKQTEEPEALGVFIALGQSKDPAFRRMAPQGIMDLAREDQAPGLLRPFLQDTNLSIRSETLIYLSQLDALDKQDLLAQLEADSYDLQCIAARCLVKIGQGHLARKTLERLAYTGEDDRREPDLPTQVMSAVALLSIGQNVYHDPLKQKLTHPRTSTSAIMLALSEIEALQVAQAVDIAQAIADDDRMDIRVRLQAHKSVLNVAPDGKKRLIKSLVQAPEHLVPHLLHLLVQEAGDTGSLTLLAGRQGLLGALARFEQARSAGEASQVARLAQVALERDQPIVIEYVLGRARMDFRDEKDYVQAYDQPLLALLESIRERGTPRGPDVAIVQQSVAILADLNTPAARVKLQELLARRYDAFQATVAAGLPRARSQAVAAIAQPLLESPYERLSAYAAFAMGKFARKEATPVLLEILTRKDRYRLPLRTLAGWYLMKIEGQTEQGAQAIGEMVK